MVNDSLRDIRWFSLCLLAGWLGRQLGVYSRKYGIGRK